MILVAFSNLHDTKQRINTQCYLLSENSYHPQGFSHISLLALTVPKSPLQLQLHALLASVFTFQLTLSIENYVLLCRATYG